MQDEVCLYVCQNVRVCVCVFGSAYSMWVCSVYSAVTEGLNPDYDLLMEARTQLFTSSDGQSVLCPVRMDHNTRCYISIAALADNFIQEHLCAVVL